MNTKVLSLLIVSIFIPGLFPSPLYSGTLEDIRKKVRIDDKKAAKPLTRTLDDIKRRLRKSGDREKKDHDIFDILSARKSVVSDWEYEDGVGTRRMQCIEVRFKIRKKGIVKVPHLCCYLFDENKKQVSKLTGYLLQTMSGSVEPADMNAFDGKKTVTVQFVYQHTLEFKYYLVVIGNDTDGLSAVVMPRGSLLDSFDFEEKAFLDK
ncbi:hypothetical protein ACFLQ8_03200 [Candidatus Auribacterota bacterium]